METELTRGMTLILMVLARDADAKHGYAIMSEISKLTDGEYEVAAGTLYRSFKEMIKRGLIKEVPERLRPDDDQRRRYYRITHAGTEAVRAELKRMEKLVKAARSGKVINIYRCSR